MAMARTGCTLAGGSPTMIFGLSFCPAGGVAPWSIHSLMSASSSGVNRSSVLGGMMGVTVRPAILMSALSPALLGTIALPCLPPFINVSKLLMSNLDSLTLPLWQKAHFFQDRVD